MSIRWRNLIWDSAVSFLFVSVAFASQNGWRYVPEGDVASHALKTAPSACIPSKLKWPVKSRNLCPMEERAVQSVP